MKTLLLIVRSEGDFERAISIGIAGKNKFKVNFIFVGDFSPFFNDGIQNKFQKKIFYDNEFQIRDFSEFDFISSILRKIIGQRKYSFSNSVNSMVWLFKFVFYAILIKYLKIREDAIIKKVFLSIDPNVLLTDQSMTNEFYLPEKIRQQAILRGIPVYIFTHGAAGGLHSEFSEPKFDEYSGCTVLACNDNETDPNFKNRIILGDMSSSYPYVHYLNAQTEYEIDYLNDRKYKIAFYIGGVMQAFTSTNGWSVQQDIIIDLSESDDVAMILKLHPREARFMDLRMLSTFNNLHIVSNDTDRSRITKWADIVVCNDHTSVVFEPMILGKKVVAIEGKHIPRYKDIHSPLKESSVNFIKSATQFNLGSLKASDPYDKITNEIAWGKNGPIDLAEKLILHLKTLGI